MTIKRLRKWLRIVTAWPILWVIDVLLTAMRIRRAWRSVRHETYLYVRLAMKGGAE